MTENIEGEIWKLIEGYDGRYEVSNMGRIRATHKFSKRTYAGKICIPAPDHLGYPNVTLRAGEKYHTKKVHRLVALAFLGNPPEGKNEVNHKNAVKTDNRVENLEYVSRLENMRHAYSHNLVTVRRGEQSNKAKLTEEQVREIRRLYADGEYSKTQLAEKYGLARYAIFQLLKGETWKHVV